MLFSNTLNITFFHPDYTVGSGITPDQPYGSRAYTAGKELKDYSFSPCHKGLLI